MYRPPTDRIRSRVFDGSTLLYRRVSRHICSRYLDRSTQLYRPTTDTYAPETLTGQHSCIQTDIFCSRGEKARTKTTATKNQQQPGACRAIKYCTVAAGSEGWMIHVCSTGLTSQYRKERRALHGGACDRFLSARSFLDNGKGVLKVNTFYFRKGLSISSRSFRKHL